MADEKVSDLPAATVVSGSDLVYLVQGGFSRRANISQLVVTSSGSLPDRVLTAVTETALSDDVLLYCDPPIGGMTLNLPDISTVQDTAYYIRNRDTGGRNVTITPFAGDLIEGAASLVLFATESVSIQAAASGWYLFA